MSRRRLLSPIALVMLAGFLLGPGGVGLLDFDARGAYVSDVATLALVVILFRDGLEVEGELLQSDWHLPLRKLVLAMPLTAVIVALAARAFAGLSWGEAFLLGALLAPTDPVLSSSVVTNPRVPRIVRHSLNLESGLNDGLALPAVLVLAAALEPGPGNFVWWRFALENLGFGFGAGLVVGFVASGLSEMATRSPGRSTEGDELTATKEYGFRVTVYALAVAAGAYGAAVALPHGNGLIAAFVAAIVLGVRRPEVHHAFALSARPLVEVVKLAVFLVFGSLLTLDGLFGSGWAAVGVVAVTFLVARPVAVGVALLGTRTDAATRAFMAWFGPKGVATMTFSLLVLSDHLAAGRRIFFLAALAVVCSVLAHGASDRPGSEWIGRRSARGGDPPGKGERA